MSSEPKVRDLMHSNVLTCTRDTPIPQVARRMTEQDVSALAVVDGEGYLEGLISRTDLVTLRAHDEFWHGLRAEHVMVRDVLCVTPDTLLTEALKVLLTRKVHRLFVVEYVGERAKPVGVLSITDIVRDMAD
jgi:CBS domain-containing protein